MISAIGTAEAGRSRRAFTLIEIVLVLALVALAGSVVIANFSAFADRGEEHTTEETLGAAIRKARFLAASHRTISELRFDKESGQLHIDGEGIEPLAFPLGEDFAKDGRGELRFYLVPAAEGSEPLPDPMRSDLETSAVRFAPDRSASPFLAEIDRGFGSAERLRFDPFSSLRRDPEP